MLFKGQTKPWTVGPCILITGNPGSEPLFPPASILNDKHATNKKPKNKDLDRVTHHPTANIIYMLFAGNPEPHGPNRTFSDVEVKRGYSKFGDQKTLPFKVPSYKASFSAF